MAGVCSVIIERNTEGKHVASVPELRACHTEAISLESLRGQIREAIQLCLEVDSESIRTREFARAQRVWLETQRDCRGSKGEN